MDGCKRQKQRPNDIMTPSILRKCARQHDLAIGDVVASVLDLDSLTERNTLLTQSKIFDHGKTWRETLSSYFLPDFCKQLEQSKHPSRNFFATMQHIVSGKIWISCVTCRRTSIAIRTSMQATQLPVTFHEAIG